MALAHHDERLENHSERVTFGDPPRPYKSSSANSLADIVEIQWEDEEVRNAVLAELLTRALEAENALASQHR